MTTRRSFLRLSSLAPLALRAREANAVAVHANRGAQEIDGFGASAAFHMAGNLWKFPEAKRNEILDLLFSTTKGAGLSIVRNIVGDGGSWGAPTNGPTPSIEPQEGVWNWKGDEEQIWFMKEAEARGCTRHMSTVWSPPAWMKTNDHVIGGRVRPDKYQAFADYLSMYVRGYKQHHGIDIYGISPSNEPDVTVKYSSCYWTGEEFRTLLKNHLLPTFARDKVKAKLILGEHSAWTEEPVLPSLNDPVTARGVDIVGAHAYMKAMVPFPPISQRSGNLATALRLKKRIWQTEVGSGGKNIPTIDDGLYWAKLLHTHVAENQANAWFYWWAINISGSRGALIQLDLNKETWGVSKRLYTLGNYSRFVRPGYFRVETEGSPGAGVYLSAYKHGQSRKLVIVAINDNDAARELNCRLGGARAASASPYRTSATEDLAALPEVRIADNTLRASLSASSVTTFVISI